MDFRFTEAEKEFRGDIVDFLQQELPDDWDPLNQASPYSPERLPFT